MNDGITRRVGLIPTDEGQGNDQGRLRSLREKRASGRRARLARENKRAVGINGKRRPSRQNPRWPSSLGVVRPVTGTQYTDNFPRGFSLVETAHLEALYVMIINILRRP